MARLGEVKLPKVRTEGATCVEKAFLGRRSVRSYQGEELTLEEVGQILWAAQGITDPMGYRTAPSAGALYPLEVYLVTGTVEGLSCGVYKYRPFQHELEKVAEGDQRRKLCRAALSQLFIEEAPAVVVICAVYERTTIKYGQRGVRYVHIEVGHAAQNVFLQAVALGLGTVSVGAFGDEQVKQILGAPEEEQPLYVMPLGK